MPRSQRLEEESDDSTEENDGNEKIAPSTGPEEVVQLNLFDDKQIFLSMVCILVNYLLDIPMNKESQTDPLFGIWKDHKPTKDVDKYVRNLRKGRS